jgi:dUTP pyrophosphatase
MLKVKKLDHAKELPLPAFQTDGAAGIDLCAAVETLLVPGNWEAIPTGIAIELPPGYVGLVCPRSGLAVRSGLTVLNSPGVIDEDYRGEVHVPLINHNPNIGRIIEKGDRIAQLLIVKVERVNIAEITELSETARGAGGFGSTGR